MRHIARLTLLFALVLPVFAHAEDLVESSSELKFPRTVTDAGKTFQCIATGIRKKAVFRVYAMAFCVEEPAGIEALKAFLGGPAYAGKSGKALAEALAEDPKFYEYVANMPVSKYMEMRFLRDVSAEKIREAYQESLSKNLTGPDAAARTEAFTKTIDQNVKEGESVVLRTDPSGDISFGLSTARKSHKDDKVATAIWLAWFGKSTVSSTLKESLASGVAALPGATAQK